MDRRLNFLSRLKGSHPVHHFASEACVTRGYGKWSSSIVPLGVKRLHLCSTRNAADGCDDDFHAAVSYSQTQPPSLSAVERPPTTAVSWREYKASCALCARLFWNLASGPPLIPWSWRSFLRSVHRYIAAHGVWSSRPLMDTEKQGGRVLLDEE
jgi:hypothetical protein